MQPSAASKCRTLPLLDMVPAIVLRLGIAFTEPSHLYVVCLSMRWQERGAACLVAYVDNACEAHRDEEDGPHYQPSTRFPRRRQVAVVVRHQLLLGAPL